MGRRETLVGIVGALLLASTSASALAQAPANKAPQLPAKFITPFKGEALIEMGPSKSSREGNLLVTTFKVKNMSPGPILGFTVDEYWYNAKDQNVGGAQQFRHRKPFMPGEIIEVTLKSLQVAGMTRRLTVFAHEHGKVKPKQVPKFSS